MAVSDTPLVLWRLRGHGRDVRCLQQRSGGGFELRIHWGQRLFLTETFDDQTRLLHRADDFRQGLLGRGWQPVAVDPDGSGTAGNGEGADASAPPLGKEPTSSGESNGLLLSDPGRRPTVLVVDDDKSVRGLLHSHLEQAGYAVCEAGDIEEALTALEQSPVDAVVLDDQMPDPAGLGRSGLEVLTYLRLHAALAAIPVLVMAEHALEDAEQDLLRRNRADFLTKPDGYRVLLQRLDELTGRRDMTWQ